MKTSPKNFDIETDLLDTRPELTEIKSLQSETPIKKIEIEI